MIPPMLAQAKVVVIGGGVAGCSLLYHLARSAGRTPSCWSSTS
jgi:glycine/D-amino acid oxidase-like deaminating enzyme